MANLKQTLSPRVMQDLKKRSFAGILIYTVALCVVLFADSYYFRYPEASNRFIWLITGICFIRLVHQITGSRIQAWLPGADSLIFLTGIVLTALVWGVQSGIFMAQPGEENAKMLMVICTIGICAGGCSAYSPCLPLAHVFNFLILWPAVLSLALTSENTSLVILFIMFSAYMAAMSARQNAEYWTALDNEALLEEKSRDLEKLSNMDGLTGLYNRRFFDTAYKLGWQRAIRRRHRLSLILCDIDHFKRVNDDHGHMAGDEYLRTMAHVLTQVFRRQTDIVARFGGEEFVVLIEDAGPGTAEELAENFRRQMADVQVQFESQIIQATVSLGVAEMAPRAGHRREKLLARADAMLYQAKQSGRNRVSGVRG